MAPTGTSKSPVLVSKVACLGYSMLGLSVEGLEGYEESRKGLYMRKYAPICYSGVVTWVLCVHIFGSTP